jgi:hypothetical protein
MREGSPLKTVLLSPAQKHDRSRESDARSHSGTVRLRPMCPVTPSLSGGSREPQARSLSLETVRFANLPRDDTFSRADSTVRAHVVLIDPDERTLWTDGTARSDFPTDFTSVFDA